MCETTFTELCSHAKVWFDLVEAGETMRVLRNGKPIAETRPIAPPRLFRKQRPAHPLGIGAEISRLILDERGD